MIIDSIGQPMVPRETGAKWIIEGNESETLGKQANETSLTEARQKKSMHV